MPSAFRSTFTSSGPAGNGASFALIAAMLSPPGSAMRAPGSSAREASIAATEIALSAAPGEPVMYAPGPLLPADATTTIPCWTALFVATVEIVLAAERRAERHVDHIDAVCNGPFDSRHDHVGGRGASASEDAVRADRRARRHPGPIRKLVVACVVSV